MRARFLVSLLAAACGAACLLACTSSGDGGEGGVDDFRNQGATVTSDLPAGALEYVQVREVSGDSTSTCIAVEAVRAFDVFNASFTLSYDPAMLQYVSFDDDTSCIGTGPVVLPTLVDAATTPGQVVVGLSRNIANTTTGVECGAFLTLCFTVIGEGDTRLTFVGNTELQDPAGNPVDVDWLGADLKTRL